MLLLYQVKVTTRYQKNQYLTMAHYGGACWFYKRRFRIETFFSDQKSRGFHIHKGHLSDPIRTSRLLIAACLAYIWMICFGLFVVAQGKTGLIDRTTAPTGLTRACFALILTGSSTC